MKGNRTIPLTLLITLIIKILSISIILSTLFLSYPNAQSGGTPKSPKDFLGTSGDLALRAEPQGEAFTKAREKMVKQDIEGRGIKDKRVLSAMSKIPRHLFVAKDLQRMAYGDHPLPIGEGQTISQPYVVALMTQVLELKEGEKVLEIGTGSGYQAAVLAEITKEVYTIEIRQALSSKAEATLKSLGYKNIKVKTADGYYGWKEYAPFDAIIITCAANHIPRPLIEQLKEGGRLVIPLGSTRYYQTLTLIKKVNGELKVRHITDVAFVPMIGEAERQR